MMHKKTIASSTVALFATGLVIVACSDTEDPPPPPAATGGASGSATGGTATGGTATGGTATGGTATGGTATGGTATGGSATGGSAGSGAGSGGAAMGFACDMPKTANCGAISDFPNSTSQTFGNADFSGGVSVFGDGIMRDMTNTGALHVTGMVGGYGRGFNIWFTLCSTLEAYTGVEFKVSGTTGDTVAANTIDFQVQTNSDYPWQPFPPTNMKGTCTAPTVDMAWSMCLAPTAAGLMLGDAAQTVTWAQIMGGAPVMWSATASPKEVVGIQWQFPWSETRTAYMVDVTLDDVKFTGGTGPTTACPAYSAGMGGAGGSGGSSAGSGGSSAGSGGSSAGSGGSSAGSGGSNAGSGGSSAGSGGRAMGGMGGNAAGSGGRAMGGAGGSI